MELVLTDPKKYTVVFLPSFRRDLHSLTADEFKAVLKAINLLEQDPSHPSLVTKKLQGDSECYESRANKSIRLIWEFDDDKIILTIEVGHHDILKKY
ncbi:MAG: type II toxin-antitoxin system RelE/ParE family toxin [Chitinispirillales bacterium]|nr:type II toxin-antitoxin system RelE/ParE family toxin [Chitinispirillales bacterium]